MEAVKTLASVFDRMLGHFVTGRWLAASGPVDVEHTEKTVSDQTLDVSSQA